MITEFIEEKGNGLLKKSLETTDYTYTRFNDGGVECEVGEFLYGMVKVLRPMRILETGTHLGVSSSYMGLALKERGIGHLETLEITEPFHNQAKQLFNSLALDKQITAYLTDIRTFQPSGKYDMLFLDSEPDMRWNELVRFFPYLSPGGYVFLHDLPRSFCKGNVNPDHPEIEDWPWGPVPKQVKDWLKSGDLVKFHFPNPREMAGFYKKHPVDYHL